MWLFVLCYSKSFTRFSGKRAHKSRDTQFFLQNVQNEILKVFKMFKNNMKFTQAACWINSKIRSRDKKHHTHNILILSLLLVIIMVLLSKVFKVGLSPSKKKMFYLKNAFCFILKGSPCSQDIWIFVLTFWPCRKNIHGIH